MNLKDIKEKTVSYLREVKSEAKKVVWPSKAYVIAASIIIFVIVLLVIVYVMSVDFCFAKALSFFNASKLR